MSDTTTKKNVPDEPVVGRNIQWQVPLSNNNQKILGTSSPSYAAKTRSANTPSPWNCAYYDNEQGLGIPLATLQLDHLASDWQNKPGWDYDGPPILNGTKSGFFLLCNKSQLVQKGSYKLMNYIKCDMLMVKIDDTDMYNRSFTTTPIRNEPLTIDLGMLHFNSTKVRKFHVSIGVTTPARSWFIISLVKVHSTTIATTQLNDKEMIACGTTPQCFGAQVECKHRETNGLSPSESPWGLCKDYVVDDSKQPNNRCIIYSIGVREIYTAELLYGRAGCEVHAFDCTINHPQQLGPNVTFHPWCLGTDSSELKLDGGPKRDDNGLKFKQLPAIINELGHQNEELTMLKMDCEGCEWDALDSLQIQMPTFFSRIRMMYLELHYVSNNKVGSVERAKEMSTMTRVTRTFGNFSTFGYSINSDVSLERFNNPMFFRELYDVGLFFGTCCFEFSMVRKDLVTST
jgi:hypothetical protein